MRSRHVLASGLALAHSLALLGDNMMYVFLPSHPGAAGIGAASLGIVLSANRFVRLAANSLGGLLSDRLGRRRPYLLGMMLTLASTTGYLVSDGLWPLLACRVVWGVAFSLMGSGPRVPASSTGSRLIVHTQIENSRRHCRCQLRTFE